MSLVDGKKSGHDARYRDRAQADMKFLGGSTEICLDGIKIQITLRGRGCLGEKVEHLNLSAGRLGKQESTATQAGKQWFTYTSSAHGTQGSIKRIAALFEQYPGRIRSLLVPRSCNPQRFGQGVFRISVVARIVPQRVGMIYNRYSNSLLKPDDRTWHRNFLR